jgi:serine/threonine protein kinase
MSSHISGQTIGEYQIVSVIGRGGMGIVYRAYQPRLQRYVALKVLPANLAMDPSFVERFNREAHLAASLDHPHIVPIYDFGNDRGMYFIAMRLIEGPSLQTLIERQGALSPARTIAILSQIASALDFAHQRQIIHRDIKPSNILIDQSGNAILTDFGLAKAIGGGRSSSSGVVGTVEYMSPEQIENKPLSAASDIYALGLVAYEMLTGRLPFQGDSLAVILHQQVYATPPPIRRFRPQLTPATDEVMRRVLAKAPEQRYPTAEQFVSSLSAAMQDTSVVPSPMVVPVIASIVGAIVLLTLCIAWIVGLRSAPITQATPAAPTSIALVATATSAPPTSTRVTATTAPSSTPTRTPVMSSPTPTLLPPATPVASGPPGLFYSENFSDPKNGVWDSVSGEISERGYDNGEYFMRIKKPYYYSAVCRRWYSDLLVEVDVRQMDTVAERYGIAFRGNDTMTDFYAFRLSFDRTFTLDKHSKENGFVALLGPTPSNAIRAGGWNRIKVITKGDQITLYINDQLVGNVSDSTYKEGCAGVVICTCDGSPSLSVRFDNFRVAPAP